MIRVITVSEEYNIGHHLDMLPIIADPKNLFGLLDIY